MTHPDKGTEMFLYELSVDKALPSPGIRPAAGRTGSQPCPGKQLLRHMGDADQENAAALATYRGSGGAAEPGQVVFAWTF